MLNDKFHKNCMDNDIHKFLVAKQDSFMTKESYMSGLFTEM